MGLFFLYTFQHGKIFHVWMNTLQVGDWQGGNVLGIYEAMFRNMLYVMVDGALGTFPLAGNL